VDSKIENLSQSPQIYRKTKKKMDKRKLDAVISKVKAQPEFKRLAMELKQNPEEAEKIAAALAETAEGVEYYQANQGKISAKEYWIEKLTTFGIGAFMVGLIASIITAVPGAPTAEVIMAILYGAGLGGLVTNILGSETYMKRTNENIQNMKYLKTFESFTSEDFDRLDEGFFGDLKDKVVGWFGKMKDNFMQKAAAKIATGLEQKKSDPVVKQKIAEIQKAFADLSDADKKTFMKLFGTKEGIEKAGEKLDMAGIEQVVEAIQESIEYGEPLNESKLVGQIVKYLGLGISIASIIVMCIALLTLAGGYVTLALAAGMTAGAFCAIGCGVLLGGGIISYVGSGIAGEAGWND
jgi:hypothetical protein